MVDITQMDHVSDGVAQLPSQWGNSQIVKGVLTSWLRPLNTFEENLINVRDGFNIFTATGKQLDIIGTYFSILRLGMSDDEYRGRILGIISTGNGSGTLNQLIDLFKSISGGSSISTWGHYPLSFTMLSTGGRYGSSVDATIINSAKAAGVELAGLLYDPYSYCWKGSELNGEEFQLVDNLGNDIVDELGNKITVISTTEDVTGGSVINSFVDELDDGDLEGGYGINYGNNYGGSLSTYSWLAESSFSDNTLLTNGGNGFVEWAGDSEFDSLTGLSNKSKPILQFANSGLKRGEPFPRQFFNWLMGNIDSWFDFFNKRTTIGTFKITTDISATEADFDNQYGGTWSYIGDDTYAGVDVYVFKRIA